MSSTQVKAHAVVNSCAEPVTQWIVLQTLPDGTVSVVDYSLKSDDRRYMKFTTTLNGVYSVQAHNCNLDGSVCYYSDTLYFAKPNIAY